MTDLEAQARLRSVNDVLALEGQALAALGDVRLGHVLLEIEELQAAIATALGMFTQRGTSG